VGVARGYHARDELNAQRFIADPDNAGQRLYATGDNARWLPDGTLEFLGRGDDQIKLRGFRLEPGEIESALLRLPEVAQAAVVLHKPGPEDGRLVAYLVAQAGMNLPGSADMRVRLRAWLLDAMLPYHFVQVDQLPLTPNGKTDRRKLARRSVAGVESPADSTEIASPLQADLMALFSEMLDRPAGLDTDFFEAGGDSLGALRLTARLADLRGQALTTGELFLHSTPRRMAARVEQIESASLVAPQRIQHLVTMRRGTGQQAVVFVHPIGGHLAAYARLALHVRADIPLFGLQAAVAHAVPYASIEERCAAYVRELAQSWSGPVILCGYSLGGCLAMEMAAQLRRAGREISAVLLLDAPVPRPVDPRFNKLRFRLQELWRFSWSDRRIWLMDQVSRRARVMWHEEQGADADPPLIDEEEMRKLDAAAVRWRAASYPGKVVLFFAERHVRGYSRKRSRYGWDQVCTDLAVVYMSCDHQQVVTEPQVLQVADLINAVVAQDRAPP
jgi:thioesterase domain-containing protein